MLQIVLVFPLEKDKEGPKLPGFLVVIACRPDETGNPGTRGPSQPAGMQEPCTSQGGHRRLDVLPGNALRQDGPDDHFEGRAAGPPALGSEGFQERPVVPEVRRFRGRARLGGALGQNRLTTSSW